MNVELPPIDPRSISKEILDKMEFDTWKWVCKAEGCNHYTRFKDYGAFPLVKQGRGWVDVTRRFLLCKQHWPLRNSIKLKSHTALINYELKIVT